MDASTVIVGLAIQSHSDDESADSELSASKVLKGMVNVVNCMDISDSEDETSAFSR